MLRMPARPHALGISPFGGADLTNLQVELYADGDGGQAQKHNRQPQQPRRQHAGSAVAAIWDCGEGGRKSVRHDQVSPSASQLRADGAAHRSRKLPLR